MKKVLVPGDEVPGSASNADGVYSENGKHYASTILLESNGRVVPLKGYYVPIRGDYVIGIVTEERFSGYTIDLNSPYEGQISSRDLREELQIGDVVSAKVVSVNEVNEPVLTEVRLFSGGELLEVDAVKIPRVIGKNGSMLQLLKEYTGADVFVGKNGRIYLRNGNLALASLAIMKISREAHSSGLTDRMMEFLTQELRNNGDKK
ncbi:hypothetical protein HUU53_03105 [Candidatus Micrarchaeota archaeon]|nr:hypothetical protein [Candidatus Micrarchaeota archaeon]